MRKLFGLAILASLCGTAFAGAAQDGWAGTTLSQRQRQPWSVWLGTVARDSELGTYLQSQNQNQSFGCSNAQNEATIALLSSLGLEFGVGYSLATDPVDLRFESRVQSFGPTQNDGLRRPHSVFGIDALFRSKEIYYGPGIGVGYASARTQGLTFEGAPAAVFSAVVGCDASERAFVEARLQAASYRSYDVVSASLGFRF